MKRALEAAFGNWRQPQAGPMPYARVPEPLLAPKPERFVLLTPGPSRDTYFEHSYLARYLGYSLVEGADLTVRDDRVYLKTLGGLQQVDVIVRHLADDKCDPLELHGEPRSGVTGLVQAVRAGHVVVANALGSSLVRCDALMAFMPGLCRKLLDADLKLPNVATWWCGHADAAAYVLANLDGLLLKRTFHHDVPRPANIEPTVGAALRADLKARVEAPGWENEGIHATGCDEASLYRRMHQAGLTAIKMFPQFAAFDEPSRLQQLQANIVPTLSPAEVEEWRAAVAHAEAEGTFFIATPFHCAVGTKP